MMSVACYNVEFGRTRLDFVAFRHSENAACNRLSTRNCGKGLLRNVNRGCKALKLWCCKTPEANFVNGVAAGPPPVLGSTKEAKSFSSLSDIFELVAEDLQTMNKSLQSIVGQEEPLLMSAIEQIFEAGGKRMQPALVFLVSRATAEIAGLKDLTEEHRRLAEITEMVHTATLIHNDITDESGMLGGKKTVHQLYGTTVAVLAGDFLFARSSLYHADLENFELVKLFSQVIKDFASGEIKQASKLFNCDIQLDEYLITSYCKTASFIAASAKGAAICSGVNRDITEQMYQYGKNLGLSFQIVDDILDFTQSAEQLGEPAGSDLAKGNLTAAVIFALEKEMKLRDIIESEFQETGSLEEAMDIVKNSGGIERARELARDFADQALQNLHCLPPSSFRLALEQMVNYNLGRMK